MKVEYSPGNGEEVIVPDVLSRGPVGRNLTYYAQRFELVLDVQDHPQLQLGKDYVTRKQRAQFGDVKEYAEARDAYVVDEDDLMFRIIGEDDARPVVPDAMVDFILNKRN